MSRENVELARTSIDLFNHRDLSGLAEHSHSDFEFVSVLTAVDTGGATFRGPQAWTSYFAAMDEAWEDWRADDWEIFDAGDSGVATSFRIVGKGRNSGVPVEHAIGVAYRFRKGKLWRMRAYLDPRQALKAVGLAE
jgi:ketosteroid isomerase-like protein